MGGGSEKVERGYDQRGVGCEGEKGAALPETMVGACSANEVNQMGGMRDGA